MTINVFRHLLERDVCFCLVNLPQGMSGRATAAAGSKRSSSRLHGTGSAHRNCRAEARTVNHLCFFLLYCALLNQRENLHIDAGMQLGNVFGFLAHFAKIQKVHTERMTLKENNRKALVITDMHFL